MKVKVETEYRDYIVRTKTVGGWLFGRRTSVTVTHIPSRLSATCCEFNTVHQNRMACNQAINAALKERQRRSRVCY